MFITFPITAIAKVLQVFKSCVWVSRLVIWNDMVKREENSSDNKFLEASV